MTFLGRGQAGDMDFGFAVSWEKNNDYYAWERLPTMRKTAMMKRFAIGLQVKHQDCAPCLGSEVKS